jgi:hypothetical protein
MFRSENTVPKTSFASSSALRDERPEVGSAPLLRFGVSEVGREALLLVDTGRGSQRRL